jgi:hypothetical protein
MLIGATIHVGKVISRTAVHAIEALAITERVSHVVLKTFCSVIARIRPVYHNLILSFVACSRNVPGLHSNSRILPMTKIAYIFEYAAAASAS